MTLPHVITDMREHDHELVVDSWLSSYRNSPATHDTPSGLYYRRQRKVAMRLLGHSDVKVARPPDWPEGVLGWLCAEQCEDTFVLHYGYVKAPYRRHGLGRALITAFEPHGRMVFTHLRPPYTDYLRNMGFSHAPHYASVRFRGGQHG